MCCVCSQMEKIVRPLFSRLTLAEDSHLLTSRNPTAGARVTRLFLIHHLALLHGLSKVALCQGTELWSRCRRHGDTDECKGVQLNGTEEWETFFSSQQTSIRIISNRSCTVRISVFASQICAMRIYIHVHTVHVLTEYTEATNKDLYFKSEYNSPAH